jgi:hypothetical protein
LIFSVEDVHMTQQPYKPSVPSAPARTLAVIILAALAVIAGILALLDAARYMGWLPIAALGDMKFVLPNAQWFAAIMSAIVGVIYFVVAWWLWNLNPSGWLFVVVISIITVPVVAILGDLSAQALQVVMRCVILA